MWELKNNRKPMIVVALWDELIFICPFYICETHRGKRKHLHMVFIYLEKVYDRVLRKVHLLVLEKKKLPISTSMRLRTCMMKKKCMC